MPSKIERVAELRDKASKYRALARQSNDDKAAQGIFELAAELEQQARDMEKEEPLAAAISTSIHKP
jgi:hypothetical protein